MDNIGLMSETVNFIQGSKKNYDSSTMQGGVYFSKDSKEILLNGESYGNAVPADEEDLTSVNGALQLKDREVDADNFLSKGYVILRKNIVDGKNILTQDMINLPNTIYEIRYDFDLNGLEITIPNKCVLRFEGGSLTAGSIVGNLTRVTGDNYEIFKGGFSEWTAYLETASDDLWKLIKVEEYKDGIYIKGTWNNTSVKSNWCGLLDPNDNNRDISRRIINHILLYGVNEGKCVPNNTYYIFGKIQADNVDFNNSKIIVIADYSTITKDSITIPERATRCKLISNYGLLFVNKDNSYIRNVLVVGNNSARDESLQDINSVGVISLLNLSGSNILILNIFLQDCLECGITSNEVSDVYMSKVSVVDVGEHGIYLHSKKGTITIIDCLFENISSEKDVVSYRGASALIKFSDYDDLDLYLGTRVCFKDCVMRITHNLSNSFCYGNMPNVLELENFTFEGNCGNILLQGDNVANIKFKNCKDVPLLKCDKNSLITEGINTSFNCSPLDIYSALNCTFNIPSIDLVSVLSSSCTEIFHTGCIYKQASIGTNTISLSNKCNVTLENCSILDTSDSQYLNSTFLKWVGIPTFKLVNCYIKATHRYIFNTYNSEIIIFGLLLSAKLWTLPIFKAEHTDILIADNIRSYCTADVKAVPPLVEGFNILDMHVDYVSTKYSPYYREEIITCTSDQTFQFQYTALVLLSVKNLPKYVRVEPLGNNYNNFSFSVGEATSLHNAYIKIIFNDREKRTFKVILDLRHYTNDEMPTIILNYTNKGSSLNRPALVLAASGFEYYDTTLNKQIIWNGAEWTNIDGTSLDTPINEWTTIE